MNTPAQQKLWKKIQNFNFDDPDSAFPFSQKLAKENNWTTTFTKKAIEEYKRFIYLCCISPTGASPSAIVDEVWHLHLTYTDNYWNRFCKETLEKDIHHHPSKGGTAEKEKHNNWYEETLLLYRKEFSNEAPVDIWPKTLQNSSLLNERIYDGKYVRKLLLIFIAMLIILFLVFDPYRGTGSNFLYFYFALAITGLIGIYFMQAHKDLRLKNIVLNNLPKEYTPLQMARYIYGNHRAYQTALVELLSKGIIDAEAKYYKVLITNSSSLENIQNPLLLYIRQHLQEGDTFSYNEGLGYMNGETMIHPQLETLHNLSKKIDFPKLIFPAIVFIIGFARFLQGMANDRPVSFLVTEMAFFLLIAFGILQSYSYTKTVRGHVKDHWLDLNSNGHGNNIINNFTILGVAAIISFEEYGLLKNNFDLVTKEQRAYNSDSSAGCGSSGGCSSGCGSSCGSGCGGCGGGD